MNKSAAILLAAAMSSGAAVYAAETAAASLNIASQAARAFDIPAGPLTAALSRFSEQTGIQVFYQPKLVEGKLASGLVRSLTPTEALNVLLEDAGLRFEEVDATTVVLKREGASPTVSSAPGRYAAPSDSREEILVLREKWREAGEPRYDQNTDLVRTMDDAQAYYIFDADAIGRTSASNIEDFMRQQLTMNSVAQTMSQTDSGGSSSRIDLRGLGTNKTLILINGRRAPGPLDYDTEYQADLNAIPMSAIERIEVLPSSASGIYGGGAIGGVVNVILKKDFSGGIVRADYQNTFSNDIAQSTLSGTYGGSIGKSGKTRYMVSGSWSDSDSLMARDRRAVVTRNVNHIIANSSQFLYADNNPFLGASPNISSTDGSNLILRDGTALNAPRTHINAGTAPGIASSDLAAQLLANAGSYNMALPDSSQQEGFALGRMMIKGPQVHSIMGSLRHQFSDAIEAYADFSYSKNEARTAINQLGTWAEYVPASSPINPFDQDVYVRYPNSLNPEIFTYDKSRRLSVGTLFDLPSEWKGAFDVTYTKALHRSTWRGKDWGGMDVALASGAFNPFVDTAAYTRNLGDYIAKVTQPSREGTTGAYTLRGSGPLPALPWGTPTLAVGLEYIDSKQGRATGRTEYPSSPDETNSFTYFEQSQKTSSMYAEVTVPLLKADTYRFAKTLELQVALRAERYDVDTGTYRDTNYYLRDEPFMYYSPADANGNPYRMTTRFEKVSPTFAVRFQPTASLMFRTSLSEAFLPPTYSQLLPNIVPEETATRITDQVSGAEYDVFTLGGGTAGLQPTTAKSFNAGVVVTPQWAPLAGLRFGVEHFRIRQDDVIGYLSAQYIINNESRFAERITRDPETGLITLVNTQASNLTHYETRGWDFTVAYSRMFGEHSFGVNLLGTWVDNEQRQLEIGGPMLEFVGYVNEGGPLEFRANASLSWAYRGWQANWNTAYYDSYYQYGAAGGPNYTQFASQFGADTYYTAPQGGDTIPSQIYHDLMVSYSFEGQSWLTGTTAQLNIRNVFDKTPPFDVYNSYGYYSTFGDIRLRSYMLSLQKKF